MFRTVLVVFSYLQNIEFLAYLSYKTLESKLMAGLVDWLSGVLSN